MVYTKFLKLRVLLLVVMVVFGYRTTSGGCSVEVNPESTRFNRLGDHLRVFRFCGQVSVLPLIAHKGLTTGRNSCYCYDVSTTFEQDTMCSCLSSFHTSFSDYVYPTQSLSSSNKFLALAAMHDTALGVPLNICLIKYLMGKVFACFALEHHLRP